MLTDRSANDEKTSLDELATTLTRKLANTIDRIASKSDMESGLDLVAPQCENGVCVLNWKPTRPAA